MTDKEYEDHTNPFTQVNFGIVDVCEFLVQAWEEVEAATIQRCWRKAGILSPDQIAQLEFAHRLTRTSGTGQDLGAVGAGLVAQANAAANVEEIDGQLVQGFREVISQLRLLEARVKRGQPGAQFASDDALADEVLDWLREGHTDVEKGPRKNLLDKAFVDNSESVCWDVLTTEQMKEAFLQSLEVEAEEAGGLVTDSGPSSVDAAATEYAQSEDRLRQLLPSLLEVAELVQSLYGDRRG